MNGISQVNPSTESAQSGHGSMMESVAYQTGITGPVSAARVFTGTVTRWNGHYGLVNEEIFFLKSSCTSPTLPELGSPVSVEARSSPDMPYKWTITKLQVLPGVKEVRDFTPVLFRSELNQQCTASQRAIRLQRKQNAIKNSEEVPTDIWFVGGIINGILPTYATNIICINEASFDELATEVKCQLHAMNLGHCEQGQPPARPLLIMVTGQTDIISNTKLYKAKENMNKLCCKLELFRNELDQLVSAVAYATIFPPCLVKLNAPKADFAQVLANEIFRLYNKFIMILNQYNHLKVPVRFCRPLHCSSQTYKLKTLMLDDDGHQLSPKSYDTIKTNTDRTIGRLLQEWGTAIFHDCPDSHDDKSLRTHWRQINECEERYRKAMGGLEVELKKPKIVPRMSAASNVPNHKKPPPLMGKSLAPAVSSRQAGTCSSNLSSSYNSTEANNAYSDMPYTTTDTYDTYYDAPYNSMRPQNNNLSSLYPATDRFNTHSDASYKQTWAPSGFDLGNPSSSDSALPAAPIQPTRLSTIAQAEHLVSQVPKQHSITARKLLADFIEQEEVILCKRRRSDSQRLLNFEQILQNTFTGRTSASSHYEKSSLGIPKVPSPTYRKPLKRGPPNEFHNEHYPAQPRMNPVAQPHEANRALWEGESLPHRPQTFHY